MKKQEIRKIIRIIEEVDRLQSKGILELDEDLQHQDLCDLSYDLHQCLENKPLSLWELQKMIGQPVWIANYRKWEILRDITETFTEDNKPTGRIYLSFQSTHTMDICWSDGNYVIYKHKPKENDD